MRSVLTGVVGALALTAIGPAAVGPSPAAGTPRLSAARASAHSPRADAPRPSLDYAIALVEATDTGTYSATYRVGRSPGQVGVAIDSVTVAQRSAPRHAAYFDGPGRWSFRTVSTDGSWLAW